MFADDFATEYTMTLLEQNLPSDIWKIVVKFAEMRRFSNTHVATFECDTAKIFKVEMDNRNRIFIQKNGGGRMINIWEWWDGQPPRRMKTFFENIGEFCIHDNEIFILRDPVLYVYDFDFNLKTSFKLPYMFGSRVCKMHCSSDYLVLHTHPSHDEYEFIWVFSLKDTFAQTKPDSFLVLQYVDNFTRGSYEVYIVNNSELWLLSDETLGCEIQGFDIRTQEPICNDEINICKIFGHESVSSLCFKCSKLFSICYNELSDTDDMVVLDYPCRRGGNSYMIENAAPKMFSKFAMSDSGYAVFTVGSSIEIKK